MKGSREWDRESTRMGTANGREAENEENLTQRGDGEVKGEK
jgi:hypothetical protein